jgi:hypothetical protein
VEQGEQLVTMTTGYSFTGPDGIIHSSIRKLKHCLRECTPISDAKTGNETD